MSTKKLPYKDTMQRQRNKKSIVKNYVYNLGYEVFSLIVPIAVTPYLARVLGDEGSGQYSFTFSITNYFIISAALGFSYYAQRLVAGHQNDRKAQSVDFWEILIAKGLSTALSVVCFLGLLFSGYVQEKYRILFFTEMLTIIAVGVDISFLFQGNEDFGKTVGCSVLVKLVGIISIFIFVKTANDLWIYALIQSAVVLISNLILWVYLPCYVDRVSLNQLRPEKHFRPSILLFIPTIATSIYTSLDKTLIGMITQSDAENGNYEYAEKLVKMMLTVLTSLGAVMTPRNSKTFAENGLGSVTQNIYKTSRFVFFLGIPMTLGSISIADNLIPWYLGDGFDKAANLMKILSPIILIIGISNVMGRQFLIPVKKDREFTFSVTVGAISNFCLNLVLIRLWKSYGAAYATLGAELLVTAFMLFFVRKEILVSKILRNSWKYCASGIVMFLPCAFLGKALSPSISHSALIVVLGVIVYITTLFLLKDSLLMDFLKKTNKRGENHDEKI